MSMVQDLVSSNHFYALSLIKHSYHPLTIIPLCTIAPRDCKDWYNNGNTTSGVYTVNPDGGTPFEVS